MYGLPNASFESCVSVFVSLILVITATVSSVDNVSHAMKWNEKFFEVQTKASISPVNRKLSKKPFDELWGNSHHLCMSSYNFSMIRQKCIFGEQFRYGILFSSTVERWKWCGTITYNAYATHSHPFTWIRIWIELYFDDVHCGLWWEFYAVTKPISNQNQKHWLFLRANT